MSKLNELVKNIGENSISHGSLPFWSWNDKLDPEELRRQIRTMHDIGMNGFFMHARGGLETEYLGDEWFEAIEASIDEAKKLGMEAWSYDENGWPSGFAGGKLLEDKANHATFLCYKCAKEFPADMNNVLAVYILEDNKAVRVTAAVNKETDYHIVSQGWDASYVDTLDGNITKKFLAATHEEYKKRLPKEDFGTAMPGFFTDEPQSYRYRPVWSETLPAKFEERFGYDIFSGLASLFIDYDGAKEFRYDYYTICHRLFIDNWVKIVYEWCRENGCQLTGHAVEETYLASQMWCGGGVMPFYEYEDMPGMDWLSRYMQDDCAAKQLGSVAAQLGKQKVLAEMFACSGWDVHPTELKRMAEAMYIDGVNVMCQHLYAYSERGQRKRDYPAHYSEHLPWQGEMKEFNRFFNNLGYLLSLGREKANTLVIHPIHSAYLDYKRPQDTPSIQHLENGFHEISDFLSGNQIPYHWGDETMLARLGGVKGDKIFLGKCTYDFVIIPRMDTLDKTTAEMLKQYLAGGGKIWLYDECPTRIDGRIADLSWLKATCTFGDIEAAADAEIRDKDGKKIEKLRQTVRENEYGRMVYIMNRGDIEYNDVKVTVRGAKNLVELDMATLKANPVHGRTVEDGFEITTSFEFAESHVFIESDEIAALPVEKTAEIRRIPLNKPFRFTSLPENEFTLDKFMVSKDGGATFTELRPVERVRDNLLRERYKGALTLKTVFTIDELPDSLALLAEAVPGFEYAVNGHKVDLTDMWRMGPAFRKCDIVPYIHEGENEITVSLDYFQRDYVYYVLYGGVSESLRNCLVFDTEIECVYLVGDFRLNTPAEFVDDIRNSKTYKGTFSLAKQSMDVVPDNLTVSGYPFFAGSVSLDTTYDYKAGDPTELVLSGRFSAGTVYVNGEKVTTLLFKNHCDLSEFLREGTNDLRIVITGSNRNIFGPHHGQEAESEGVGPWNFSYENAWNEGNCGAYVDRYAFVRFGFDTDK